MRKLKISITITGLYLRSEYHHATVYQDSPMNGNRPDKLLRSSFDETSLALKKGTPFWNDATCREHLEKHRQLRRVMKFLPHDIHDHHFRGQRRIQSIWSSYKDHGYQFLFYGIARAMRPANCVEIGVLGGFSLLTVASALRENSSGFICGFDLFEDYRYRHEKSHTVLKRIEALALGNYVEITKTDADQVQNRFDEVDYLHVDISNDGDTYRGIFERWADKVNKVILLEGGSPARDRVHWMQRYNKPPICQALYELKEKYRSWEFFVFQPYPSITVAIRKPVSMKKP